MDTFTLRHLSFTYPGQTRPALSDVSLSVEQGAFLVVCGASGCGKTTLLRQLKPALSPHGRRDGEILFEGLPLEELDRRAAAGRIGFVQQSPDSQIVTDRVWHELAFGLESLGWDTPSIRSRVAEMAAFFGIEDWFYRDTASLSGGQKQLLNLAAVMVTQPAALILDEPTAQLDPIAASDFLAMLGKIHRELGTTVILTEHRLEEVFPLATEAAVLDRGRLICTGTPREAGMALRDRGHAMFLAMPAAMRVWAAADTDANCPVTVREGRDWLKEFQSAHPLHPVPETPEPPAGETVLSAGKLWFRYEQNGADVVKGLSLTVGRGELLALLGGNGAGKTTALKLLSGLLTPQRGEVCCHGTIALLPQDPQALFVKNTVREELAETLEELPLTDTERGGRTARMVRLCRLEGLLDRHPYDLSGGEQQRTALAKVLLTEPDLLLLDEPTKGLDAAFKQALGEILQSLRRQGTAILMVSHDVEFCARYAGRCALFFDGGVVTEGPPRDFFSGNSFYTTAANRMARPLLPRAVTPEDLILACGGVLPPPPECPPETDGSGFAAAPETVGRPAKKLPRWRKYLAVVSGLAALAVLLRTAASGGLTPESGPSVGQYAAFLLPLLVLALCVRRPAAPMPRPPERAGERRPSRRSVLAAGGVLLLIPLTLLAGQVLYNGRKYYFIALLILLEAMLPFFLLFEGRRPRARELAVMAVLCAIGAAGRAAFFMLPQCKPVMALTILAGTSLGGQTGFLVGAVTMLTSNILFGQGPWTPWQMFAMGFTGFLAGVLFHRGPLPRSRGVLSVFGALSAVVIYGGIMNPAAALLWAGTLDARLLLAYYLSGLPMDCVQAAATALFLWFAAEPMLEKLDRVKTKYGLLE